MRNYKPRFYLNLKFQDNFVELLFGNTIKLCEVVFIRIYNLIMLNYYINKKHKLDVGLYLFLKAYFLVQKLSHFLIYFMYTMFCASYFIYLNFSKSDYNILYIFYVIVYIFYHKIIGWKILSSWKMIRSFKKSFIAKNKLIYKITDREKK